MKQPTYLSNVSLDDAEICRSAAEASGFDVRFLPEPMPYDGSYEDEFYDRESLIGVYGCLVSFDDRYDHSPFWLAWDEIKGRRA